MVIGLILFAILGLTLGYTVSGPGAWIVALAVPLLFALLTALVAGLDDEQFVVLLVALAITAGSVLLGRFLDRTFSGEQTS